MSLVFSTLVFPRSYIARTGVERRPQHPVISGKMPSFSTNTTGQCRGARGSYAVFGVRGSGSGQSGLCKKRIEHVRFQSRIGQEGDGRHIALEQKGNWVIRSEAGFWMAAFTCTSAAKPCSGTDRQMADEYDSLSTRSSSPTSHLTRNGEC